MNNKFELLERDIRNNCRPNHWYTHLLLIRLQEDRLLARTPALFHSWGAHLLRHLLPFILVNFAMTWLAWRHGNTPAGPFLAVAALLLGVGTVVAALDWEHMRQARTLLRLPTRWEEYPQRPMQRR